MEEASKGEGMPTISQLDQGISQLHNRSEDNATLAGNSEEEEANEGISRSTSESSDVVEAEELSSSFSESGEDVGMRQRKGRVLPSHTESSSAAITSAALDGFRSEPGGCVDYTNLSFRASGFAHRKLRESPLSSDAIFHQSHAGLFNLCVVLLLAVNGRLIIENLMKYGILIRTGFWFSSKSLRDWPLLMCGLSLPIFPFFAYLVEKLQGHYPISEHISILFHALISSAAVLYPIYVIQRVHSSLFPGLILMLFAITCWMKLVSYAHTNYDLRILKASGKKPETPAGLLKVEYPDNICLQNLAYFMVAPTLCYQVSYPQSEKIRKGWVLRQSLKLVVFTGVMGFIAEQYINPTIKNSQHPLKGNYLYAVERVLKLSIPTLYCWLCMFYCFFHLWLNINAELIGFGDREFYKDWWNAKTIEEYWRMWNMPVHKWMIRHVYFPCMRKGISKNVAVIISFAISGVFHEVCIGIPCHMLRYWAFLGIMFQVPLVVLTNYLQKRFQNMMVGNMIFWFLFCIVGQPMCVLLYYHDVIKSETF